jgi:Fe-S cluster assembly ATP-binding protein
MTAPWVLDVCGLCVSVAGREILRGVDLHIAPGEVHALMGPNGSGKSTLGHALAGRPGYEVTSGTMRVGGVDLAPLPTHERAAAGLFLAFQYPVEVPGVRFSRFMEEAAIGLGLDSAAVEGAQLAAVASRLGMGHFADRALNVGLSGGEKKRNEALQLALLDPKLAILDEIDSGVDVDGIRLVGDEVVREVNEEGLGVLVITHYARVLEFIPTDHVHVLVGGRIVRSGGADLAAEIERAGYDAFR